MSSDLILAAQLDSFMRAVPEAFSWEALQSMLEPRISHREHRGAKESPRFAFALDVLDQGQDEQSRWLLVFVNVTDTQRKEDTLGGSSIPLGVTFTVYDTGKVEMPRLEEIFSQFDQWHAH